MSYAGHVLDMIKRMKVNRALQKKRRSSFKDRYQKSTSASSKGQGNAIVNEISEAEKKAARDRLALQFENDKRKARIVNMILVVLALLIAYQFYIWFFA